jgi:endoglucanase
LIGLFFLLGKISLLLAQSDGPETIVTFQRPFLFSYGTWQNASRPENDYLGVAASTGQGGGGYNFQPPLDLSSKGDLCPALRLRIQPGNSVANLRVALMDVKGHGATWNYSLQGQKSGEAIDLIPFEGASLAQPNDVGQAESLDLTQIMQCQVQGDWTKGPVDLQLISCVLLPANEAIRAARAGGEKRRADETASLAREHDQMLARYKPGRPLSPWVESISAVAPDIISISIHSGRITPGHLEKYVPQAGDVTTEKKLDDGRIESITLTRDGKDLGWLIGPKRDWLTTRASFAGDPILDFVSVEKTNYSIRSNDDENFKNPIVPDSVERLVTPTLWAEESDYFEMRDTLFLKLPRPLVPGKTYTVDLGKLNTRTSQATLSFDPAQVRSDAVHVNQIGYRPDDLVKRAFVSCWMGTGGPLRLPRTLNFALVDDKSGTEVWRSRSTDLWPVDKPEQMQRTANFSGTDVMRLDFSPFNTPGRYRLVVDGVGCSYPFEINRDVWQRAFWVQMKGLYNQRSGTKLGVPYTDFIKPRDMHAGDPDVRVTWTKARSVEKNAFENLAAEDTGKPAPGWGGYDDAGDWNPRRVTHMATTLAQLEVFDLFPDYFAKLNLNIPPTPGLPDLLTEAIFEFETFHRLQQPDG